MAADPDTSSTYPQTFFQAPDGACQILLVRHGQSAPYDPQQPFPLVDGHGDPPLSPLGQLQASLVARRLVDEPISAVYQTTLVRTHQTAAPLAEQLGLTPTVEPDLREVFLGVAEGGRLREMIATGHPDVMAMRKTKEWGALPGAETNQQLTERTVSAVRRLARHHPGELIAAFCHGGVISAVLGYALGAHPMAFRGARHTSINHIVVGPDVTDPESWNVRTFNDGAHAGSLLGDADIKHISP